MTVKEFLSQYADAFFSVQETRKMISDLESLKSSIKSCSFSDMAGDRRKVGGNKRGFADIIAEIDAKERDLRIQVNVCLATLEMVRSTIEAVPVDVYRHVLTMRYLNRMSWESIAHDLDYDTRYIFKICNRAFTAIMKAFPGKFEAPA